MRQDNKTTVRKFEISNLRFEIPWECAQVEVRQVLTADERYKSEASLILADRSC